MTRLSVAVTMFFFLFTHSIIAANLTNALWNDSGSDETIGFWIYPITGECPDLRKKALPLVFAGKPAQKSNDVSDLSYCFKFLEDPEADLHSCENGKVTYLFDESKQIYIGEYSFLMVDGTKEKGSFTAQYCPKI